MKSWTVVAYTYAAANLCTGCTRTAAAYALAGPGEAAFQGRPTDGDDVETFLDRWATRDGVDRTDERSYDSDEFPKVVFVDQITDGETCDECGDEIL